MDEHRLDSAEGRNSVDNVTGPAVRYLKEASRDIL